MVFFDSFLKYCELRGESPSMVMENAGVSHSLLAGWRRGVEPTNPTKLKLAKYLGISVTDFTEEQKEKPTTNKSDELAGRKEKFDAVMLLLSDEKRAMVEDFAAKLLHMQ